MDDGGFLQWITPKTAVLFAAVSGAFIHVLVAWKHPWIAARQFVACALAGINFGPAMVDVVEHYTWFTSEASKSAVICATGLCGIYLTEGLIFMAKRWSQNPVLPGRNQ